MFITKKHLSRRTILRGGGSILALPLLDAMIPAATALSKLPPVRSRGFVGCFVPHGATPGYWVPPPGRGARCCASLQLEAARTVRESDGHL